MAAELNESELDDSELAKVVLLQAHVRGYLVRKWMGQLRGDFSGVVEELGLEPGISLHWRSSTVCLPVFSKTKPQPTPATGRQDRSTKPYRESSRISAAIQTEAPHSPENAHPHHSTVTQRNSQAPSRPLHQKGVSGLRGLQVQTQTQSLQPKTAAVCDRGMETEDQLGEPLGAFAHKNRDEILRLSDKFTSTSQDRTSAQEVEESAGAREVHLQILSPEGEVPAERGTLLPAEVDALRELRKNTALELLWIQQAIKSRKNYLKIKAQMQEE